MKFDIALFLTLLLAACGASQDVQPTVNPNALVATLQARLNASQTASAPPVAPTLLPAPTGILQSAILDIAAIIDHPSAEIEAVFGRPLKTTPFDPGKKVESLTGGEEREYTYKTYGFSIIYNKTLTAKAMTIYNGLAEEKTPIDAWAYFFPRVGLIGVSKPPDGIYQDRLRRWDNHHGYMFYLLADPSGFIQGFVIRNLI